MKEIEKYDSNFYQRFIFPQNLDKAIHTLEGIIKGIAIDNEINSSEIEMIRNWSLQYDYLRNKQPFNELLPLLDLFLEDGVLTKEEQKDIIWFCKRFSTENSFFNVVTSDMQRLQGILVGITADGKIDDKELIKLSDWIEKHDNLKGCWPYDEIDSVVTKCLSDNKIDEQEHRFLMAFFSEFMKKSVDLLIESDYDDLLSNGVCSMCPDITFNDKVFCFTGKSSRSSRKDLYDLIEKQNGYTSNSVNNKVDFLIIGDDGNPCWAFSCYGRKVEEAMQLRKQGGKIQLIHENDFWDAVEDNK